MRILIRISLTEIKIDLVDKRLCYSCGSYQVPHIHVRKQLPGKQPSEPFYPDAGGVRKSVGKIRGSQASEVGPQGPRSRPQYFGQLPFWGRRFFSIRDLFVLLPRHRKSHIVSFMCQYSNGLIIIDPCCQLLILVSILLLQFIDLGCSIEKNC